MGNNSNIPLYNLEHIQQYVSGAMSREQQYAFEKAMLNDDFLADAVEGFKEANTTKANADLLSIEKELLPAEKQAKTISFYQANKKWLQIAAMIIVVASAGVVTYSILQSKNTSNQIAKLDLPKEKVNPPIVDSAQTIAKNGSTSSDSVVFKLKQLDGNATVPQKQIGDLKYYKQEEIKQDPSSIASDKEVTTTDTLRSRNFMAFSTKPIADKDLKQMPSVSIDQALQGRIAGLNVQPQSGPAAALKNNNTFANTNNSLGFVNTDSITKQNFEFKKSLAKDKKFENSTLDEVTIIGYGSAKKKTINASVAKQKRDPLDSLMPEGGWQYFNDYVNKKVALLYDSTAQSEVKITDKYGNVLDEVELEFSIDQKGIAYDVKVTTNIDADKAKNIAEIVQEGPKWTGPKKKNKAKVVIKN